MRPISRRVLLAGASATALTGPAIAQRGRAPSGEIDCVIVGAGAAGIAAARRLRELGRSVVVLEAAARIGGRCVTDAATFGVPFDRGAHLLYAPDVNPLSRLAPQVGFDIATASAAQRIRVGRRNARDSEFEDYLSAQVRANRAVTEGGRGRDVAAATLLPKDLDDWTPTIAFGLGPFATGRDLTDVSAADLARAVTRDTASICRLGIGALVAKLGEGVPVRLNAPVRNIDVTSRGVELITAQGTVSGRFCIITASTNAILDRLKIQELPKRQQDALERLKLGSFDRIGLELNGNPLGLSRDDAVFEKATGARTAALVANVGGSSLSVVEVGGKFGRELSAQGDKAMVEFAVEWLTGLFGPGVRKSLGKTQVTQWDKEPTIQGAFSAASPGAQPSRRVLMEPVRNRLFFAGEAAHETLWGTVGGAWESGVRAADAVNRRVLGQPDPRPDSEAPAQQAPARRGRRS